MSEDRMLVELWRKRMFRLNNLATYYERLRFDALVDDDRREVARLESLVTMYRDGAKSIEKIVATLEGAK